MHRDDSVGPGSADSGDGDGDAGFSQVGRRRESRPANRDAVALRRTSAARRDDGDALRWRWLVHLAAGAAAFAVVGVWATDAALERFGRSESTVWLIAAFDAALADAAASLQASALVAAGVALLVGGWVALAVGLRTRASQ